MILTPDIYTTAKGQGIIKKRCEFEGKPCKCCSCPEVYAKGNISGEIVINNYEP